MLYDIASKRLAQLAPVPFLSLLLQSSVDPATQVEELPQEMPTLNRADQVWRVISPGAEPYLVLSEFLTHWDADKKLDVALYTLWLKKRYRSRVVPVILLCLPNQNADDTYVDENCRFKFKLLKANEMEAEELFVSGELSLYPLLPLMRGGLDLVEQAGQRLYESELDRPVKGDLLTLLGLFLGLTDKEKATKLIWKRTDLMNVLAESPVYKQILDEGWQKGQQQGRIEGESGLVLRLLRRRFGALDAEHEAMVKRLPVEELEDLGDALLSFQNVQDLSEWLAGHRPVKS